MDEKARKRIQLDCLYDMFRDRIEENVVYIVYSENEGKIDATIDQLMPIANSSFTGHNFEQRQQFNSSEKRLVESNIVQISSADEPAIDNDISTIEEHIERLQSSINELLLEKKLSNEKASQYMSKRMYQVTSYYSELASQLRKMIEDKTSQLVDLLLQKSVNSSQIDLHGLNPIQASLVVSELLRIRQSKLIIDKQSETTVDIITGWGKHSNTHGQRVRPAIVALLREKGYEYHRLNKGALRVTVRKRQ